MNPSLLLGALASLFLLAGCVPKTDTAMPLALADVNADLDREIDTYDRATLDETWWKGYGDPQLDSIVSEALSHAPGLQAIEARTVQARSIIASAESANAPGVSADTETMRERFSANHIFPAPLGGNAHTLYHPSLGMRYEFDFWNARASQVEAARNDAYASKAYLAASRLALEVSLCDTYLAWHYDEKRLNLLRELEKISLEELSLSRTRYALGLAPRTEVREGEQRYRRILQRIAAQGYLIEGRKKSLCVLAGFLPSRASEFKTPRVSHRLRTPLPKEIVMDLLSHRPDVAVAKYTLLAKHHRIEHAKAQFYPNIVLSANLGFTSFERSTLLEYASATPGIGIALSLPLFDGGEREANLQNAAGDYNASVHEYNDVVIRAANEVVGLLKQSAWLEERIGAHHEELALRGANEEAAWKKHRIGLCDKLPALAERSGVLEGELDGLEHESAMASLQIALIRSLGGGYRDLGAKE